MAAAFVTCFAGSASATHLRAANLTWVSTPTPDQARYNLTLSFRRSYFTTNYGFTPNVGDTVAWAPANAAPFTFGDAQSAQPTGKVVAVNAPDDFLIVQVGGNPPPTGGTLFEHTFATAGPYESAFTGCCTLSTIQNNHDQNYRAFTTIDFAHATGAPLSSVTPIVDFGNSGIQRYTIPAVDPDNHTLTFRLATTGESGVIAQPAGLSIDPATGKISWDTTAVTAGLYQVAIVIEAHQSNATSPISSSSLVTFLIRVSADTTNHPPAWDGSTPADLTQYNVVRGQALSVNLSATDEDPGQTVHIDNLGLPAGATVNSTDGHTATSTFAWTPNQVGDYLVTFTAQDDQTPPGSAPSRTIIIHVNNRPPVAALSASPTSGEAPLPVVFSTTGTGDPDGAADVTSSTLSFGDGSPDATTSGMPAASTSHTYAAAGTYTATLTVHDASGATASATRAITVGRAATDLVADASVVSLRNTGLQVPLRPVAHLTRHSNGTPIAGRTIVFSSVLGSPICVATTDATGTAACNGLIPLFQTALGYRATFGGDAVYSPSTSTNTMISIRLTLL